MRRTPGNIDPKGIILERHRYGDTEAARYENRMQAMSGTKDLAGREDMHLSMLGTYTDSTTSFTPGDFVVLRDQVRCAWSWGRVESIRSNMVREPNGVLSHAPYTVSVKGWFDFLGRTKVQIFQQGERTVGTLYSIIEWESIHAELQTYVGRPAGEILMFMLRKLLRIKLPPSLGGGWLADEVRVIYDEETATRFAPEFQGIEPVSFGTLMPQVTSGLGSQRSLNVGSLLASMFVPDSMLIEMVPYLSVGGSEEMTPLGKILGVQPVVVYRIKPFRMDPLYTAAVTKVSYSGENLEIGYLDKGSELYDATLRENFLNARRRARTLTTQRLFEEGMFSQQTFTSESLVSIPSAYISQISRGRNDGERLNATTINATPPPSSGEVVVGAMEASGLPITIDDQIENHGLRMYIPTWPFYPPPNSGDGTAQSLTVFYRTVAAQVMQFYQSAHLFDSGSLQLHFTNTLKIKEDYKQEQTTFTPAVPGVEPGRWFRTKILGQSGNAAKQDEYYGYITAVSHNLRREADGMLSAATTVQFVRGHFSSMWDLLHGVVVPIGAEDYPQQLAPAQPTGTVASNPVVGGGNPKPPSSPPYSGGNLSSPEPLYPSSGAQDSKCSTYSLLASSLDACADGRAAAAFPSAVPANKRPTWLRCWATERISANLGTASATNLLNTLDGKSGDAATQNNLWASIACMYVLERYWRIRYPRARIMFASVLRKDSNHNNGSAIDFYLKLPSASGQPPGALQIWASLKRLSDAKRIPVGGRGLYLNVNPVTGIQGTTPELAGSPTSGKLGYPLGASSWTHYDIRGSFGVAPGLGPKWISTDWLGRGSDQLTVGRPYDPTKRTEKEAANETGAIPDSLDVVLANLADPNYEKLNKYARMTAPPPRIGEMLRLRFDTAAILDSQGKGEQARVPIRDAVKAYYNNDGKNDPFLHTVDARVPNVLQVLGIEASCLNGSSAPAPAPVSQSVSSAAGPYGQLDVNSNPAAPLVVVFGGVPNAGRQSGDYMYDYVRPLLSENSVFVAKNTRVSGAEAYAWITQRITGSPRKRILYMFSGGQKPSLELVPFAQFDKIYLVDAYLKNSIDIYLPLIQANPGKFVYVYTRDFAENGTERMEQILATGVRAIKCPGIGRPAHMATNERAVADLIASGLVD